MKKIYDEYLYVPEEGKVHEKTFLARITLSIVIMVLCLGAMGFTAYAFFTCNITSGTTTIQSARYDLDMEVTDVTPVEQSEAVVTAAETEPVTIAPNEEGYFVFENKSTTENEEVKDKTYEFVLKKPNEATASVGYGKFEIITDVNEADGSRQLYYTTPIGKYLENGQTVEKKEFKLKISVPANKTVKVRVIAEWGTCARGPAMIENTTIVPDFKDSKYMHISFGDVSHSLLRLKNAEYTSLYEEPFFAWLKSLHDAYGAKFSIYAYVNILEQVPDTYKEEFAAAKDWLKIGLHAKDMSSSYAGLKYDTGVTVWNRFAENVLRITGTYDSIDRMPKLENFAGSREVLRGMKEADLNSEYKYGAIGFVANIGDTSTYYLDATAWNTLHTDDFYIDKENDVPFLTFVAIDLQFGSLDAVAAKRQEQYVAATAMHSCLAFMSEGQIYNENGFIQDEAGTAELLKSQVEELCEFANSNGIKFNYPQTRDFGAIEEAKLAAKAAQEAAEKAAAEKAAQEAAAQKDAKTQSETSSETTDTQNGTQTEIPTDTSNETDLDTKSEQSSDNKGEEQSSE